ncbi:MAG: hypothetical protein ACWGQW_12860, partial [bacterium]
RGVNAYDICETCQGFGTIMYGSTATWRGGIGGAAMTIDVCDKCWGTGRKSTRGPDQKALEKLIRLVNRKDPPSHVEISSWLKMIRAQTLTQEKARQAQAKPIES